LRENEQQRTNTDDDEDDDDTDDDEGDDALGRYLQKYCVSWSSISRYFGESYVDI